MNYQKLYDRLIEKYGTWEKPKEVYTERHRKLPGYLGGEYVKGNAFYVAARVHYLCHILWAKITGHAKAWAAVKQMGAKSGRQKSKMYETAKIYQRTEAVKIGQLNGKQTAVKKTGIHGRSKEEMVEHGRNTYYSERGLSSRTREQRQEAGKNAGIKTKENKVGVHARTREQILTDASIGGTAARIQGKGVFARSKEQHSVDSSKAGSQRWQCDECGMTTSPGALGKHQNSTKHKGRKRIK